MKISKKVEKTEPEKILEEITPQEEKIPTDRLKWELERNALELGAHQFYEFYHHHGSFIIDDLSINQSGIS